MRYKPVVDPDKCTSCESCIEFCEQNVFEMFLGKARAVRPDDCTGCPSGGFDKEVFICVEICPEEAIIIPVF